MSTINARTYSTPKNINLKEGLLRFGSLQASGATPIDSSSYGLYVNSDGALVYSGAGSATVLGAGGGSGVPTWESIFGADYTLTITTDNTFTIAGAHDTATAVMTITNSGASTSGPGLQITSGGSGVDINGTSSTWYVTKAGAATFVGLTPGGDITSTATAIDWDLKDNDSAALSFDTSGLAKVLNIVTTNSAEGVTMAGYCTVSGRISASGASNTVANLLVKNDTATTFGADADEAGVVVISSSSLTTGSALQIDLTEGTLNGGFYLCCRNEGSANVATIGEKGATVLAGSAAGTSVLTLTLGDLTISDTNASSISSADGTTTLLTLDNVAGVIASDSAVLLIDAGGAVASGGNLLRVAPTGTPNAGAIGIEFVGASKAMTALYIDADPTGSSVATINGGGALTDGYAVLQVISDGALASGGSTFSVRTTGTPASGAIYAEFDYDGVTDTNENVGVFINAAGKKVQALSIDADPVAGDVVYIHSDAIIADNKAMLNLNHATGASAAGSNIVRIEETGTVNAGAIGLEMVCSKDMIAVSIASSATTNDAVYIAHAGNLATGKAVMHVTDAGTPAADPCYVGHFAFTGTATNESSILFADGGGKDVNGLKVDTDNTVASNSGSVLLYTDAGTAQGPSLVAHCDSATPAADDQLFGIYAYGEEATSSDTMLFGQITIESAVVTDGAVEGAIKMAVVDAAAYRESFWLTDDTLALGDSAAFTIGSNGSQDLTISTAITTAGIATNEPKIVMTDGAAGDITITAGGTSGEIVLKSPLVLSSVQTIENANTAIDVVTAVTSIANDASSTHTLADGVVGQIKYIFCETYTGDAVITPTNLGDGTTITLNAVGDSWLGIFAGTEWHTVALTGTAAVA